MVRRGLVRKCYVSRKLSLCIIIKNRNKKQRNTEGKRSVSGGTSFVTQVSAHSSSNSKAVVNPRNRKTKMRLWRGRTTHMSRPGSTERNPDMVPTQSEIF